MALLQDLLNSTDKDKLDELLKNMRGRSMPEASSKPEQDPNKLQNILDQFKGSKDSSDKSESSSIPTMEKEEAPITEEPKFKLGDEGETQKTFTKDQIDEHKISTPMATGQVALPPPSDSGDGNMPVPAAKSAMPQTSDTPTDAEDLAKMPKKLPTVEGEGTSAAKFSENAPVDAEMVAPKFPKMPEGMPGIGLPVAALAAGAVKYGTDALQDADKRVKSGEFNMPANDLGALGNAGIGNASAVMTPPSPLASNIPPSTPPQPMPASTEPSPAEFFKNLPKTPEPEMQAPAPQSGAQQLPVTGEHIQALLNTIKSGNTDNKNALADAQQKANQNQFYANLMHAANQIGSGLGGVLNKGIAPAKVDDKETLEALTKGVNAPVEQFNAKIANEKNDPSSKYSQAMRDFLKPQFDKLKIPLDDDTPASVLEKIAPYASKEILAKQRDEFSNLVRQKGLDLRQEGLDQRVNSQTNREFDSNTKNLQDRMDNASNGLGLIENLRNKTVADSKSLRSALTGNLASLITGGRGSKSDRENTAVDTAQTKLADFMNYLDSAPDNTTIPPKYLDQIQKEYEILQDEAVKNIHTKSASLKSGLSNEKAKDAIQNRHDTYLTEKGYDPKTLKRSEKVTPQTPSSQITRPSNVPAGFAAVQKGDDIKWIPAKRVKDAEADGYKQVQ